MMFPILLRGPFRRSLRFYILELLQNLFSLKYARKLLRKIFYDGVLPHISQH